jgi:hypothetical protein
MLSSDSLVDNRPLLALISKYVTPELLAAVAAESNKWPVSLVSTADWQA